HEKNQKKKLFRRHATQKGLSLRFCKTTSAKLVSPPQCAYTHRTRGVGKQGHSLILFSPPATMQPDTPMTDSKSTFVIDDELPWVSNSLPNTMAQLRKQTANIDIEVEDGEADDFMSTVHSVMDDKGHHPTRIHAFVAAPCI